MGSVRFRGLSANSSIRYSIDSNMIGCERLQEQHERKTKILPILHPRGPQLRHKPPSRLISPPEYGRSLRCSIHETDCNTFVCYMCRSIILWRERPTWRRRRIRIRL